MAETDEVLGDDLGLLEVGSGLDEPAPELAEVGGRDRGWLKRDLLAPGEQPPERCGAYERSSGLLVDHGLSQDAQRCARRREEMARPDPETDRAGGVLRVDDAEHRPEVAADLRGQLRIMPSQVTDVRFDVRSGCATGIDASGLAPLGKAPRVSRSCPGGGRRLAF